MADPIDVTDPSSLPAEFGVRGEYTLSEARVLAAGNHPLFGELEPDDGKAYISYRICRALPNVIGPESHGMYLGFHPQVLARCHRGLLHQQNNLNHKLKAYGAYRDQIMGCVIGTAVPAAAATMGIPGSVEEAPGITVLAVVFKMAQGVAGMLGEHLSSRPWSVSIESRAKFADSGVYDPGERAIIPFAEVSGAMKNAVKIDPEKGPVLGTYKGNQLAMAMGGEGGEVAFDGVGYTPNPAESTAEITEVRASSEAGEFRVAACAAPDWVRGMAVKWVPLFAHGAGRGTVCEVYYEGEVSLWGDTLQASAEDPVLRIALPWSGREIIRPASSVVRA